MLHSQAIFAMRQCENAWARTKLSANQNRKVCQLLEQVRSKSDTPVNVHRICTYLVLHYIYHDIIDIELALQKRNATFIFTSILIIDRAVTIYQKKLIVNRL